MFSHRTRDNQENRASAFPKTPAGKSISNKTAGLTAKNAPAFVTPAQPSRAPLGNKSTNVHHRQFQTSVKTGRRHSPVTAVRPPKLQIAVDRPVLQQQEAPKLDGIAALRAALDRSLETGIDIPDVEYAPPPVEELPYAEPDNMYPMDWDAFNRCRQDAGSQYIAPIYRAPQVKEEEQEELPVFVMMGDETSSKDKPVAKTAGSTRPTKLGSFAAPTAATRARAVDGRTKATSARLAGSITSKDKAKRTPLSASRRPAIKADTLLFDDQADGLAPPTLPDAGDLDPSLFTFDVKLDF